MGCHHDAMTAPHHQPPSFAQLLTQLIEQRKGEGLPASYSDIASATGLSKGTVGHLATGQIANPGRENISVLARFFGVPVAYFFPENDAADRDFAQLMEDAGVRSIAARAVGLSPSSQAMVLSVLDQIRKLEGGGQ